MPNYNSKLQLNNTTLQTLLNKINDLPEESSGVELPELTEPATEDEVFLNQEYIDANGEKKSGTFTIDAEMSTQNNLITQIQTALANKAQVSPVLQAKSVTPSAVQQIVTADGSYDGLSKVTVAGDSNLVPENIMSGISIFGVEGSATGGGGTELEFVTITYNSLPAPGMTVYYLDESLTLQSCAPIKGYSFSALKNSILIVIDGMEPGFPSCTYIAGLSTIAAYQVTG